MRRRGLRVTTSVAVDDQAGHGILTDADAVGCDSIAMATYGRTGVSRVILGSAADKVLGSAAAPGSDAATRVPGDKGVEVKGHAELWRSRLSHRQ